MTITISPAESQATTGSASTGTPIATPAERAARLVPLLAEGAAAADETDSFVAGNYALLKQAGLVEAGVPAELGGQGAGLAELSEMLRILARGCSSTALAFSMHTHQVAVPAWRWRQQKLQAAEPLLRRVAAERIILLSSGGSDWIGGSGEARRVEGGYRISGRKAFSSGSPAGDLMMTGAVLHEPEGESVLHFAVPMKAPEVRVLDNWRALGMRGTGSNDVLIQDLFIADAQVALKRKAGEWHPLFHIIATIAFPLIYAVYLGVAEHARDVAVDLARKRPPGEDALQLAGRMDTALQAARLAHGWMLSAIERHPPSAASVNEVMIGRALVAENAIRAVELAMELAGGAGFCRASGLERLFRDIQGARFHPLQAGPQSRYAGAMALGLPVDRIF
ncbi:acyl-CoA dehydrogenase family protein [Teichococcus oryzae]|uniref:Acyl-CoA dehydrogenase n=1 Tax=Teichococcus oryzae TaxID=1608942 RepID=A0A5B2TKE0_9PROT|nr:acyl-CoA dehydrogenase family protein [Pseudoroseomonas oryzae]KAA2214475.1 acyl-CoA dehydrogenase [Pseudoroseomonas oryzae]